MMIGNVPGFYGPYAADNGGRASFGVAGSNAGHAAGGVSFDGKENSRTAENGAFTGSVKSPQDTQGVDKDRKVKEGYRSSPAECQTCKERKYQDGSDESDVSFKSPGHISPKASASTVMAHERQHVSNAYQKAAQNDGKVVSCSVSLHTAICPECGTVYVSGGTTHTAISYPNESNPYQQNKKAQDATYFRGANFDDEG